MKEKIYYKIDFGKNFIDIKEGIYIRFFKSLSSDNLESFDFVDEEYHLDLVCTIEMSFDSFMLTLSKVSVVDSYRNSGYMKEFVSFSLIECFKLFYFRYLYFKRTSLSREILDSVIRKDVYYFLFLLGEDVRADLHDPYSSYIRIDPLKVKSFIEWFESVRKTRIVQLS